MIKEVERGNMESREKFLYEGWEGRGKGKVVRYYMIKVFHFHIFTIFLNLILHVDIAKSFQILL